MLITNDPISPAKNISGRRARRMKTEQRLAESIRFLGLDALSGADCPATAPPSTSCNESSC
ncbi:MAG: hypothetical protein F2763_02015 [Actinobacteria bacterium]|nr:hypothetical protein [Actinomycetota bacterium]